MIHLDKSYLDHKIAIPTEPILIVNNQDSQPSAEIFTLHQKKQKQTDGLWKKIQVTPFLALKTHPHFPFRMRQINYQPKIGKKFVLTKVFLFK